MKNNKKPFGLSIASHIAAKAIHDNVAPVSTILCNMFFLQKDSSFPKNLDTSFFSINRYSPTEQEKKNIISLLDGFKQPNANPSSIMESFFETGWVRKVQPKETPVPQKIVKPNPIKKTAKKNIAEKPKKIVSTPTITIKRNKLS